jgi:hypothetical protein
VTRPISAASATRRSARITVAPGGWASIETARTDDVVVDGYEVDTVRKYGKAKITLLRKLSDAD